MFNCFEQPICADCHDNAGGGNGDGSTALNSCISPTVISSDNTGNLFFDGQQSIRKIASGTISTILNKVTSVMATDNSGSLYFANINEHKIYKFTTTGVLSHIAGTGVMAEVEPGEWAFFMGNLNQDEFIDGNDFPAMTVSMVLHLNIRLLI